MTVKGFLTLAVAALLAAVVEQANKDAYGRATILLFIALFLGFCAFSTQEIRIWKNNRVGISLIGAIFMIVLLPFMMLMRWRSEQSIVNPPPTVSAIPPRSDTGSSAKPIEGPEEQKSAERSSRDHNAPPVTAAPKTSDEAKDDAKASPREFTPVTTNFVRKIVKNQYGSYNYDAFRQFKGKWMHLSGKVFSDEVHYYKDAGYGISLMDDDENYESLFFDERNVNFISEIKKGQYIKAACQIDSIIAGDIFFYHCSPE